MENPCPLLKHFKTCNKIINTLLILVRCWDSPAHSWGLPILHAHRANVSHSFRCSFSKLGFHKRPTEPPLILERKVPCFHTLWRLHSALLLPYTRTGRYGSALLQSWPISDQTIRSIAFWSNNKSHFSHTLDPGSSSDGVRPRSALIPWKD